MKSLRFTLIGLVVGIILTVTSASLIKTSNIICGNDVTHYVSILGQDIYNDSSPSKYCSGGYSTTSYGWPLALRTSDNGPSSIAHPLTPTPFAWSIPTVLLEIGGITLIGFLIGLHFGTSNKTKGS